MQTALTITESGVRIVSQGFVTTEFWEADPGHKFRYTITPTGDGFYFLDYPDNGGDETERDPQHQRLTRDEILAFFCAADVREAVIEAVQMLDKSVHDKGVALQAIVALQPGGRDRIVYLYDNRDNWERP